MCITSLNLSSCGLSWKSAEILAEVVKVSFNKRLKKRRPSFFKPFFLQFFSYLLNKLIGVSINN